jgi:hypothetical protein
MKYEYRVLYFNSMSIESSLNKLGEEGWRLVKVSSTSHHSYYVMERELQ